MYDLNMSNNLLHLPQIRKQLEEERNLKRKQENDLVLSEKADALKVH